MHMPTTHPLRHPIQASSSKNAPNHTPKRLASQCHTLSTALRYPTTESSKITPLFVQQSYSAHLTFFLLPPPLTNRPGLTT